MRSELFDYCLPPERIAQTPIEPRDASRLMALPRAGGPPDHHAFRDLPELLQPGDLLVFNDTRVLPARLRGRKLNDGVPGAVVEALLLQRLGPGRWEALCQPARRLREGAVIRFGEEPDPVMAVVEARTPEGARILRLTEPADPAAADRALHDLGEVPLPPYIHEPLEDAERYQTMFAREEGAAAAPTAGLHFTPRVMEALQDRGVQTATVTLHVGLATFRPIKTEAIEDHDMHVEWYSVPPLAAEAIAQCEGRVIAVGTTTVRALESAATGRRQVRAGSSESRLYLRPGSQFQIIDGLLTNFHMPRSSLLVLVSAFLGEDGRERLLAAYEEAQRQGYRFLSFGDVMLVL